MLTDEQGRAAVSAWQNTIDAAWQEQSALLAGAGQGQPDIDAARAAYFGPVGPDAQRQVIQTGAGNPASRDGIIVSRFYIANPDAALGTLHGDGRGPTADPAAGYRFAVAWDTRTGEVSMTLNPSVVRNDIVVPMYPPALDPGVPVYPTPPQPDSVVPALPITVGPGGDPNNIVIDQADPNHLKVSYNVVNSLYQIGQANGSVDIALNPDDITVRLGGDDYPDGEFIQHNENGSHVLATKAMSPLQEGAVVPGVAPVDPAPRVVPRS